MLGDPEEARKLIHPGKNGKLLREHVVEAAPLEDTLHITLDRSPVAADVVIDVRLLAPEVFHNARRLPAEREIKGVGKRVSDVGRDAERALPSLCGKKRSRGRAACPSAAALPPRHADPRRVGRAPTHSPTANET